MQNSIELRSELSQVIEGLKDGKVDAKNAKEIINAAGKIVQSLSVELKHDIHHKVTKQIKFLAKPE